MKEDEVEIKHSKLSMVSYGFNSFSRELLRIAFTTFVYSFYRNEIKLDLWLLTLAYVIFAIYNMFNDPLVGYLTNRLFKFTKRWGRMFPWILLGGLPWGFSYFLLFIPPKVDPVSNAWIIFTWLLFTICLFDAFHSILFVIFQSLFTEKFRSIQERRTASGIYIMIGVIGVTCGTIVPPIFFNYGDVPSYAIQGIAVAIITTIGFLLAIPGSREDQYTIDLYLKSQAEKPHRESFFKSLFTAIKQKPFIVFMVIFVLYQSLVETMQAAIQFTIRYSLQMDESANFLIFAAMMIGVLVSTPFWTMYSRKVKNNKKIMLISALLLAATTLPITFLRIYIGIVINMLIWGVALGGFWIMIFPVSADIVDNSIVLTKRREEGIYTGFQQFFGRLGIIVQALTFAIVQSLTGFKPGEETQTALAIWGIHIQQSTAPFFFILIGAIVFWIWYDLTPDRVRENQARIKELNL
jgi:GPH family glycoside/pentoside/hexuronide:cation symporter